MKKSAILLPFVLASLLMSACNRGSTTSIIRGFVWLDENEDGLYDPAEKRLFGVDVELHDVRRGDIVSTDITMNAGEYSFEVSPGEYVVKFIPSDEYVFTLKDQPGGNCAEETCDSDVYPSGPNIGKTDPIILEDTEIKNLSDAGLVAKDDLTSDPETRSDEDTLEVQGTVWLDTHDDGLQDLGEAGVEGIRVELIYGDPTTDTYSMVRETDEGGNYFFELHPEEAKEFVGQEGVVVISAPDGYRFASQDIGPNDTIDSDVDDVGSTEIFPLVGGESRDYDAGLVPYPIVVTTVYQDPANDCTDLEIIEARPCESGSGDAIKVTLDGDGELTVTVQVLSPNTEPSPQIILFLDLDQDAETGVEMYAWDIGPDFIFFGDMYSGTIEGAVIYDAAGNEGADNPYVGSISVNANGDLVVVLTHPDYSGASCSDNPENPLCNVNLAGILCMVDTCDTFPNEDFPILSFPPANTDILRDDVTRDETLLGGFPFSDPMYDPYSSTLTPSNLTQHPACDIGSVSGMLQDGYFHFDVDFGRVDDLQQSIIDSHIDSSLLFWGMGVQFAVKDRPLLTGQDWGPDNLGHYSYNLSYNPETGQFEDRVMEVQGDRWVQNPDAKFQFQFGPDPSSINFMIPEAPWMNNANVLFTTGCHTSDWIIDVAGEDDTMDLLVDSSGELVPSRIPSGSDKLVDGFIYNFNQAIESLDIDGLIELLHPAVIEQYGEEACRAYLTRVVDLRLSLKQNDISDYGSWTWTGEDLSEEISDVYTVSVDRTIGDQTDPVEIHLGFHDNLLRWFTYCE